ncbi:MAG: Hpt domain-containing protein [Magnetococcales bacterium]|nr:Hpt domain-containing protein [Magnetococcales bacterium]
MQDHIAKPVDPKEMFTTLVRWIKPESANSFPKLAERGIDQDKRRANNKAEQALLPDIQGVDTQSGLLRMGGNIKGYRNLLTKFRINHESADTGMREALAGNDLILLEQLAHTLRGVSATIGAGTLAGRIELLESAIKKKSGSERIEYLLGDLTAELACVCTAIDQSLPTTTAEEKPDNIVDDTLDLLEMRNRLFRKAAKQLAIFDTAIVHTLSEMHACALSAEMLEWVSRMELQVAKYEFAESAETLTQCACVMGIDLEMADV